MLWHMGLTIRHTRLITLLLISFIVMILVTGLGPAAGFFGLICMAMFGALLILSLPLVRFIDNKLCVQMLN